MYKPDLVSEDHASSRILVVEVKQSIAERDREFFMEQLRSYATGQGRHEKVYYVLVDNDWIRFYQESSPEPLPLGEFPTRETLKPYIGADYSGTMSEFLMAGMTLAWLRDLALHWKEPNPPQSAKIEPDIVDLLSRAGVHAESVP